MKRFAGVLGPVARPGSRGVAHGGALLALALALLAAACGPAADDPPDAPTAPTAYASPVPFDAPVGFVVGDGSQGTRELTLFPEGMVFEVTEDCWQEPTRQSRHGSWYELSCGVIALEFAGDEPEPLHWVDWGPRAYLLHERSLPMFLLKVAQGRMSMGTRSPGYAFLTRRGDRRLDALGEPVFPPSVDLDDVRARMDPGMLDWRGASKTSSDAGPVKAGR